LDQFLEQHSSINTYPTSPNETFFQILAPQQLFSEVFGIFILD